MWNLNGRYRQEDRCFGQMQDRQTDIQHWLGDDCRCGTINQHIGGCTDCSEIFFDTIYGIRRVFGRIFYLSEPKGSGGVPMRCFDGMKDLWVIEYLEPCYYGDGYATWKAVTWDIRRKFNAADDDPIIVYTEQEK